MFEVYKTEIQWFVWNVDQLSDWIDIVVGGPLNSEVLDQLANANLNFQLRKTFADAHARTVAKISDRKRMNVALIFDPTFRDVFVGIGKQVCVLAQDAGAPGGQCSCRDVEPPDDCVLWKDSDHVCNGRDQSKAFL